MQKHNIIIIIQAMRWWKARCRIIHYNPWKVCDQISSIFQENEGGCQGEYVKFRHSHCLFINREECLFYNSSNNSVQLIGLFSIKEVAAYLKVSQRLVRRMIASGELEAMKVGREWRVPIDAIAAWVDNNREWKRSVINTVQTVNFQFSPDNI